jgi:surfactin synthase thioesterase subunit
MPTHAAPLPRSADAPPRGAERPWIIGRVTPPDARLRLLCLPQAGGSASSFGPWRVAAPPGVELATVELPGRGVRSAEPVPDSIEELAQAVVEGVTAELDMPYALFGHSFGALLGYEIAVEIRRRGLPAPRALVVSASRAPHGGAVPERMSDRDDAGLLAWLEGFGGFPSELARYTSYLRYALRTVRRDLTLTENYMDARAGTVPERLDCPLHVLGGDADPLIPADRLERWRDCAGGDFTKRLLPGGHDYLFTGAPAALAAVTGAVR